MSLLGPRHLTKRFGPNVVVDGASFSVDADEFLMLVRPPGYEKPTLLRQIGSFSESDLSETLFEGRNLAGIPPEMQPVYTVFQGCALFPHMAVVSNISLALRVRRLSRGKIAQYAGALIEGVRLRGHENHFLYKFLGGQWQHIAIARVLAADPRLLLLDEPLSTSDVTLQAQMQHGLIALQWQVEVAFVYVMHDQVHALALSQRIVVMQTGHVVQIDKPEIIYRQPMTRFVAGFIDVYNLLDGTVERAADGRLQARVDDLDALCTNSAEPSVLGSRDTVAVRPERIQLQRGQIKTADDQSSSWLGIIRDQLYQGDAMLYTVELVSGPRLRAMVANAVTVEAGQFQ